MQALGQHRRGERMARVNSIDDNGEDLMRPNQRVTMLRPNIIGEIR